MKEGKGGEYCVESGQVLLKHVTCPGGKIGYLGSHSAWDDRDRPQEMGEVAPCRNSYTDIVWGPETPEPSLDNRWFKEMSGRRQH